jgi:putative ABC transport system substrate-binding protein
MGLAQGPNKRPLVAFLMGALSAESAAPYLSAFNQAMQELGWAEGRNYDAVYRYSGGDLTLMPALADELVRLEPALILVSSTPAAVVVRKATATIPIVAPAMSDPVRMGLAASYARPEGNVTGIVILVDDMQAKQFELAAEVLPGARKIGTLTGTSVSMMRLQREVEATAAERLGVTNVPVVVADPEEFESAFETFVRANVQVVVVYPDQMLFNQRKRLIELALVRKLPTVFTVPEQVEDGGLISYGISLRGNFARAAAFVDKILKGAKPADLPIEFPTKFEMAINLKTAKALGLTIPPSLLARADEVIE